MNKSKGRIILNGSREGLRKSSRECFDSIFSEIVQDQTQSSSLLLTEIEIIDQAMALETSIHRFLLLLKKKLMIKIKDFLSFLWVKSTVTSIYFLILGSI